MNGKACLRSSISLTALLCAGLAAAQAQDPAVGAQRGATAGSVAAADNVSADNTAANVSDRHSDMATPTDQSNDADAIKVTAAIRKAVIGDKTLSTSAHNVKIITSGNTVTLRGPVVSTEEKERIAALARRYAQGKDVLDQLTVKGV
jgi:hyperosmotically inducible periplasmic protein